MHPCRSFFYQWFTDFNVVYKWYVELLKFVCSIVPSRENARWKISYSMAERVNTIYHSLSGDGKKVNSLTVDCQSVNPCLAGRQVWQ